MPEMSARRVESGLPSSCVRRRATAAIVSTTPPPCDPPPPPHLRRRWELRARQVRAIHSGANGRRGKVWPGARVVTLRRRTTCAGPRAAGVIGYSTGSTVVMAAAFAGKAMAAPTAAVAPSTPGSHAEEYSVVEVSWPVVAVGRAGVGRIAVVAVGADWWRTTDVDDKLRLGGRCEGEAGEQCSGAE